MNKYVLNVWVGRDGGSALLPLVLPWVMVWGGNEASVLDRIVLGKEKKMRTWGEEYSLQ